MRRVKLINKEKIKMIDKDYLKVYLNNLNSYSFPQLIKEDAKNRVFSFYINKWPVKTYDEKLEFIQNIIRNLPSEVKDIQEWYEMTEIYNNMFKIYIHLPHTDFNEDELEYKMNMINNYIQKAFNEANSNKNKIVKENKDIATSWIIQILDKNGNKLFVSSPFTKLTKNYNLAGVHNQYTDEYSIEDVKKSNAYKNWSKFNPQIIPLTSSNKKRLENGEFIEDGFNLKEDDSLLNENINLVDFAKECKEKVKEKFPNIKISINTNTSYSKITVNIMSAPKEWFTNEFLQSSNRFVQFGIGSNLRNWTIHSNWLHDDLIKNFIPILTDLGEKSLTEISKIFTSAKYDNSNPQADYFDTNYYFNLNLGKWDKPLKII